MIRWAVCLILSTSAFAQHYGAPGAPSSIPMDYNDDIYNRDMRIPHSSNFIFNFEQARRDQPPQVEMREENLGKYMGRPRTTTPIPVMPNLNEQRVPEIDTMHLHRLADVKSVSMKPYVQTHWDPISSHLPATLPPAPTTPRWMDLSDDSFKHHSHHQPRRYPTHVHEQAPVQPPVPQWTPPAPPSIDSRVQQPEMSYSNEMPQYAPPNHMQAMPTEHYMPEPARTRSPSRGTSSRGSHKFNWDDVKVPETAPMMPTTPVPAPAGPNRGPPPSIPTLSPWYDGFGK